MTYKSGSNAAQLLNFILFSSLLACTVASIKKCFNAYIANVSMHILLQASSSFNALIGASIKLFQCKYCCKHEVVSIRTWLQAWSCFNICIFQASSCFNYILLQTASCFDEYIVESITFFQSYTVASIKLFLSNTVTSIHLFQAYTVANIQLFPWLSCCKHSNDPYIVSRVKLFKAYTVASIQLFQCIYWCKHQVVSMHLLLQA